MADIPQYTPNPYANFDPSQWTNPYSNFQNSAIPFPASYAGWPTDAQGNPIQPQPGMTLNSSPASPAAAPAAPAASNGAFSPQQAGRMLSAMGQWGISSPGGNGMGGVNNQAALDRMAQLTAGYQPQPAAQASPAAAAAPSGGGTPLQVGQPLTSQQYLQLRANPGRVVTPGATVAQASSPYQPGSGVLQAFLQNWQPAQSGPGSNFQQAFNKALRSS